MMLSFTKMNATGNDFIVIDNRLQIVDAKNTQLWKKLCSLKTGIGADGVLLLENSTKSDFRMRYMNADGGEVEMCGNGARAITAFANNIFSNNKITYKFETMNGIYECSIDDTYGYRLKMTELYDVFKIDLKKIGVVCTHSAYLNTGVPHCVFEVKDLVHYPVFETGKQVRYHALFEKGANANFFEVIGNQKIQIRTYERGVENETLSCGTGVTATAIIAAKLYGYQDQVSLVTPGGELTVKFNADFSSVYLCGKVEKVFTGNCEV